MSGGFRLHGRYRDSTAERDWGTTTVSIGRETGDPFAPSKAAFVVNYRLEEVRAVKGSGKKLRPPSAPTIGIRQVPGSSI